MGPNAMEKRIKQGPGDRECWEEGRGLQVKTGQPGDFPGGPVVKTRTSTAGGMGSIPGLGIKIPHAVWCSQKLKNKYIKGWFFKK